MIKLKFTLREPDRGRDRFRSRQWWASGYWVRPWRRECSPGCSFGEMYEYNGALHPKSHREKGQGTKDDPGCRRAPVYLGHVAKGWWHLWTWRDGLWMWSSELMFAVGGEDNMVQVSLMVPILGRASLGVKVPRAWTKPWVYTRRELGVELRGLWPTVSLGWDEEAHDMHDYYLKESRTSNCLNCDGVKWAHDIPEPAPDSKDSPHVGSHHAYSKAAGCPGFEFGLPPYVSRAGLFPGWQWCMKAYRLHRLKNRVLGAYENTDTILKTFDPVVVTLPEGDYPGKVTFHRSTLKRARWPRARRDEVYGKFETELWMPWPGKGENSWDCGDDGTQEHTEKIGSGRMNPHEIEGSDVAKVVSGTIATVLRYRARYGRFDWQPEAVGKLRP